MLVTFMTTPELAAANFHLAAPLLQPVVDQAARGEFTVDDIKTMTEKGRAITAVATQDGVPVMAMSFEFLFYPRALGVNIIALGGHQLERIAELFWSDFRAWCVTAGATFIEASCSAPMARLLRAQGFTTTYQVVRASL